MGVKKDLIDIYFSPERVIPAERGALFSWASGDSGGRGRGVYVLIMRRDWLAGGGVD